MHRSRSEKKHKSFNCFAYLYTGERSGDRSKPEFYHFFVLIYMWAVFDIFKRKRRNVLGGKMFDCAARIREAPESETIERLNAIIHTCYLCSHSLCTTVGIAPRASESRNSVELHGQAPIVFLTINNQLKSPRCPSLTFEYFRIFVSWKWNFKKFLHSLGKGYTTSHLSLSQSLSPDGSPLLLHALHSSSSSAVLFLSCAPSLFLSLLIFLCVICLHNNEVPCTWEVW